MRDEKKSKFDLLTIWEGKAKQVYTDSLKLMRDGIHGLEVVAEKTMEVTRIKLANQKAIREIKLLFSDLGQRVYDIMMREQARSLHITPDLSGFVQRIQQLQQFIEKNLNQLRHVTVTPQQTGKSTKTAGKRKSKNNK